MSLDKALIYAYEFAGTGSARPLGMADLKEPAAVTGWRWVHLDRAQPETERWLKAGAGLDSLAISALLEEETRPRVASIDAGLLVILRGVNLNQGADPEDMVSIRVWLDERQVITLRHRKVMAAQDLRDSIDQGLLPVSPGEVLVRLTGFMIDRMGPILADVNDAVDELEEEVLESPGFELRTRLSKLRRQAISLRRFLAPLREVLTHLASGRISLLTDLDRNQLRETADRLTRYVEELDSARDRAAVTQEELAGRMADEMNRNMYVLSIVAGIFLPLGLLTGLLGINVGGIPGTQSDAAFYVVCGILLVLSGVVLWLFKRFRML